MGQMAAARRCHTASLLSRHATGTEDDPIRDATWTLAATCWSLVRPRATVMTRRRLADPFVVAPPAKAVAKTRLRPSPADEEVLSAVGRHLGSLLRSDVAARCRLGPGPKHMGRGERKRRLTPECSSRWAGAITRTADEMHALAVRNLNALAERDTREIAEIDRRSALPTADRRGDAPTPLGRQ